MADTSPVKGNVAELLRIGGQMANVMFNLAQRPGEMLGITNEMAASMKALQEAWDAAARATLPSPSTAPEVDELPAPPTLPRYLLDMIGEYGMARTDSVGQLEVQHRWEILIGGIKRYASEYGRALASRPAEVDDEGLPGLPKEAANIWYHRGLPNFDDTDALQALDDGTGKAIPLFTAEQFRQGQRDAVAADRARRGSQP